MLILPAIGGEELSETKPFVIALAERSSALLAANARSLRCIRCGDSISESLAPSAEIDEEGADNRFGLCHERCLQPTDRVLGGIRCKLFADNSNLKDFDYTKWYVALPRGQIGLRTSQRLPGIKRMLWNPGYQPTSVGQWCVRLDLEDGSARYAHERGRVSRLSKSEAELKSAKFNSDFAKTKGQNDYWCYTSEHNVFTTYSVVIEQLGPSETCIECISATAVRYAASFESCGAELSAYYAPLLMFVDQELNGPVIFHDAVFLLTDPLSVKKYLENWASAGLELPAAFVASIVATDVEFDALMRKMDARGVTLIINPMLKPPKGELASGIVLDNYERFIGENSAPSH